MGQALDSLVRNKGIRVFFINLYVFNKHMDQECV